MWGGTRCDSTSCTRAWPWTWVRRADCAANSPPPPASTLPPSTSSASSRKPLVLLTLTERRGRTRGGGGVGEVVGHGAPSVAVTQGDAGSGRRGGSNPIPACPNQSLTAAWAIGNRRDTPGSTTVMRSSRCAAAAAFAVMSGGAGGGEDATGGLAPPVYSCLAAPTAWTSGGYHQLAVAATVACHRSNAGLCTGGCGCSAWTSLGRLRNAPTTTWTTS